MEELLRLLGLCENLDDHNDEELAQLLDDLRAESERVLDGDPSDEDLETLRQAAAAVEQIETEQSAREEQAADRQEQIANLRNRITGQADGEGEGDGDAGAGEGDGAGEGEGDGDAGAGAGAGDGGEGDGAGEGEGETETPEAVAAAASRRRNTRVSRVAARRPSTLNPRQRQQETTQRRPVSIVAAANLADIPAGQDLSDPSELARAFITAYEMSQGYRGPRVKVPVARVGFKDPGRIFGEDRTLRMGSPEENTRKIDGLVSRSAIRAAGGVCAPAPVNYDMPTLGSDARPVRDQGMARVGADRGAIRTFPPPVFTDTTGAIGLWTNDNDITPGGGGGGPLRPATKPCLTLTCPDDELTVVEAITKCLEIGNFRARFFPEQVQAWIDNASIAHARFAENRLIGSIAAGSTQVTVPRLFGASLDLFAGLERAVEGFESRWRLDDGAQALRFLHPGWLLGLIRADIIRGMNGTGTYEEKLGVADAQIMNWIRVSGVNPTGFLDGEAGQIMGAQADGPLVAWPAHAITYLYPEGSWLFLDGGSIDLGIVRDTTVNATNDYQIFSETFEAAHFHGVESLRVDFDLCPDGTTAGTVDAVVC